MDASQYKDYVLTLLFVKYVSDKYRADPDALIEVPEGGSFDDMVKLKGDKEIGDKINKIIARLAEANDLRGVIDQADFNDETKLGRGQEMQDRLSRLIGIFESLDFSANRAEGDDLLGDAYEYLMRHFATESGKSKGQFYTPAEVSRVMAQVIGIERARELDSPTVYDPTCGSGSLLIKAADTANTPKLAIYGQEMDVATWALARMNMILHGYPTAEISHGNTLAAPDFMNPYGSLKTFDFAVANPPFSARAWTNGLDPANDRFGRFEDGTPPAKNGDYAFLLHLIKSLKSQGKGAIILPHGVLYRGKKEGDIRRNLVQRGLIKGIIGLPANLFYGTGIPACIVVIDKEEADIRQGIFMLDASRGFIKDGNKNRLREQDIRKIVDVFREQTEIPGYSRLVSFKEIADPINDYNLKIPSYIDSRGPEDLHDLHAHMNGGIPKRDIDALEDNWAVFPHLRQVLFHDNGHPGYMSPSLPANQVRNVILKHPDFQAYQTQVQAVFDVWRQAHEPSLRAIRMNTRPREVIQPMAEDLLQRFRGLPLLDPYDLYQKLMDHWQEIMQDDVYMIGTDGWVKAAQPRLVVNDPSRKIKETPDLTLGGAKYKMDLLPPGLILARYLAEDLKRIENWQRQMDELSWKMEELEDQHGGEDAPLSEIREENKKAKKADIEERLASYQWVLVEAYRPEFKKARDKAQKALESAMRQKKEIEENPVYRELLAPLQGKRGMLRGKLEKRLKALGRVENEERQVLQELMNAMNELDHAKREINAQEQALPGLVATLLEQYPDAPEAMDVKVLLEYQAMAEQMAALESAIKEAQMGLDKRVLEKYKAFSEDDIKEIVVTDKWFSSLQQAIGEVIHRVATRLVARVQELEERYVEPLPKIEQEVETYAAKVCGHLKKMGVSW